jgi:hypothetical protein
VVSINSGWELEDPRADDVDTRQGAKTGEAKEEKTPSLSPSKILEERTRGAYNGGTDVKYHGSVRSIEWRKGVARRRYF